jgi:hypothetical protein
VGACVFACLRVRTASPALPPLRAGSSKGAADRGQDGHSPAEPNEIAILHAGRSRGGFVSGPIRGLDAVHSDWRPDVRHFGVCVLAEAICPPLFLLLGARGEEKQW